MTEPSLPTGMVTFLLTDVEGSTRIWEHDRTAARVAFGRHDALVAEHLAAFGGGRPKDQGEGDSAFAVFARASDAVACAVALQRALQAEDWPGSAVIRVRMALHTGEAELSNGNYKGSAVHRCARLRGLAHGGQIVVSDAVVQILRDQLPADVTLLDLGVHALRGLVHPEHVYQLCHPELPEDFPALQSVAGRPRDLPSGADVPVPAALRTSGEGVFVGRVAELAQLSDAWASADTPGARIVLLRGEAGIGKSRLAAQFAVSVHERGATVLYGQCDEEALRPYQPFAEMLSTYLRALPGDQLQYRLGRTAVELERLVPELSESVPEVTDAAWSDAESQRFRLFEAVGTLLAEVAANAPALLVIDDLHWADSATLLLVRHLARHAEGGRLVILGTYREEYAPSRSRFADMLVALDREHVLTHVDVGGLDDDEVAELLERSTTANGTRRTDVARRLRDETEGNPFFIRQMLGSLDDGESLDADGQTVAAGQHGRAGVPSGVRGLVAQRVARLADPADRVLTAASVVGREFTFDLVGSVTDADEDAMLDVLDEAVHAGLLREVPSRVGAYTFSHALVRQALYEGLTAARRARLHQRVGDALEALSAGRADPPLAELAYHFCQAAALGARPQAIEYAARAGDRATQLLAYEDASRHYTMALEVLDGSPDPDVPRRFELLCAIGEGAWRTSDIGRARESFLEAAELARGLGDSERLAIAALGFGGSGFRPWWTEQGLVDEVLVGLLEEALDALPGDDSVLRVELLGLLSQQLYFLGDDERQPRLADESLAMARRVAQPVTLVRALCSWRLARWHFANVHERLAACNEALALARHLDHRELVMQTLSLRFVDLMELGDVGAADADAAALDELARALHVPYYLWTTTLYAGMRALMEGRFGDAESLAAEGYEHGQRAHGSVALHMMGAQVALLRREQGNFREFQTIIGAAADRQRAGLLVWSAVGVLAALEAGDRARARLQFEELAANRFADVPDDLFRSITLGMLAESCAQLGDASNAAALYELLRPHGGQLVLLTFSVLFLGSVSYYLGILAFTTGAYEDAVRHLRDAMECHSRIGAAPFRARTQLQYVRVLLARASPGDRERVHELLDAIVDDATRLGLHAVLADADALRAALT